MQLSFHICQKKIAHVFQWTKWLKKRSVFKIILYYNKTIRMITNIVRDAPEDIVRGAPFTDRHRRGAHLPLFQQPAASGGLRHRRIGVGAGAGSEPLATGDGARGQVTPRGHAAFGCWVLPIGAPLHVQKKSTSLILVRNQIVLSFYLSSFVCCSKLIGKW